jgi:transcriptional regulator with XRE-family HTH domain
MPGESHPNSKLTSIDIAEIKTRYDMGETQQVLADDFGVSRGHISNIVRGKKWS